MTKIVQGLRRPSSLPLTKGEIERGSAKNRCRGPFNPLLASPFVRGRKKASHPTALEDRFDQLEQGVERIERRLDLSSI
jgi:hypothetical protein